MDLTFVRLYLNLFSLLLLLPLLLRLSVSVSVDGILPGPKCTPCLSKEDSAKWSRAFHYNSQQLPLILEVSDRPTHWIINYIFKFLAEERLGYTDVQFVKQPSDNSEVIIESLVCLDESCTQLPYAHINLEVWLPLGKAPKVLVPGSSVNDYGPLGPVTHSAILLDAGFDQQLRAKTSPRFVHYRENGIAELSQNEGTGNFSCTDWNCDPSALRDELLSCNSHSSAPGALATSPGTSTTSHSQTLLSWYPYGHDSQANTLCPPKFWYSNGLEKVRTGQNWREDLPRPYSPVLTTSPSSSGSNCRFHSFQAVKLGWDKLQTSLPLVHHLLTRFSLSQVEYDRLLTTIAQLPEDPSQEELDRQYQCIASKWVRNHQNLWLPWTTGWDKKQILTIAGLFSFYGKWVEADLDKVALKAVNMANNAPSYFRDMEYKLELDVRNLTCSQDIVLNDYYAMLAMSTGKTLVGVIASLCSDSIQPVVEVANFTHTLVISPTVESTFYGEAAHYPYFFRTVPSMSMAYQLLVRQFVIWGWKHVAVFRKDGHFITPRIFYSRNISLEVDFELKENALNDTDVTRALDKMGDHKSRIFIVEYFAKGTAKILCAAAKRGWHFNAGYVWFLNPWLSNDWWLHDDVRPAECSVEEMANITAWTFTVDSERDLWSQYEQAIRTDQHGQHSEPGQPADANSAVDVLPASSSAGVAAIPSSFYGTYTRDAVHVLAFALVTLLRQNASAISVFNTPRVANTLQRIVSQTVWLQDNFDETSEAVPDSGGTANGSGAWLDPYDYHNNYHPLFDAQNERIAAVWLLKQRTLNDTKVRLVWHVNVTQTCWRPFDPPAEDFDKCVTAYQLSDIFWPNGGTQIPGDGSDTGEDCSFRFLSEWFHVTCATATAIFSVFTVIVIAVPVFATCFAYYRYKLKEAERRIRQPYEELCAELADIDLPCTDIILNRPVGQGAYGLVYGGEVKFCGQWEAVAVKLLDRKTSYEGKTDFLCEAKLMRNLNHKNVIRLLGICLRTKDNFLYLIMEFMPFGDLKAYLLSRRVLAKQSPDHEDICPTTLTRMAADIAQGLGYLHDLHLVHRDVACRNCLVGRDRVVKVSDFGLTRQLSDSPNESYYRCMRNFVLPVRWMAPESFQFGTSNVQSDIWSYGILLYEVITFGIFPYEALDDVEVIALVKHPDFCIVNMLPPAAASTTIARLIHQCCQHQWQHRPSSMEQIVSLLRENPNCVRPFLTDEPPKPSTPIDLLPFQPGAGACMMSPDCPVSNNTQASSVTVADLHPTPSSQLPSTANHSMAMPNRTVFSSGGAGKGIMSGFGRSSFPYRSADSEMITLGLASEMGGLDRPAGRRRYKTADDSIGSTTCQGQFPRRGTSTSSGGTAGAVASTNTSEEGSFVNTSQRRHDSGGATSLGATAATTTAYDGTVAFHSARSPSLSTPGIFSLPVVSSANNNSINNANCMAFLGKFGVAQKKSAVLVSTSTNIDSVNCNTSTCGLSGATSGHQPESSSDVQPSCLLSKHQMQQQIGSNGPPIAPCDNTLPNGIPSSRSLSVENLISHKKSLTTHGHCTKSAPDEQLSAYYCTNVGKESKRSAVGKDHTRPNISGHPVLGQMIAKGRLSSISHHSTWVVPTTHRSRANHMVRSVLRLVTRSGKATLQPGPHLTTLTSNVCAALPNSSDIEKERVSLINHGEYLPLKSTVPVTVVTATSSSTMVGSLPLMYAETGTRSMPDTITMAGMNLPTKMQDALPVTLGRSVELEHRPSQPVTGL